MRVTLLRKTFGCLRKLKLSNISTRPRLCASIVAMSTEVGPASPADAESATKEAVATALMGRTEGLAGTKRPIDTPVENVGDGAVDPKKAKTEEQKVGQTGDWLVVSLCRVDGIKPYSWQE